MNISTNNNFRPDNWSDLVNDDISNIRVNGTYPNGKCYRRCKCDVHQHLKMHDSPFLLNQHKPYGFSTVRLLDPFDDRPDWWKFVSKTRKKRQYVEVTPDDCEAFHKSLQQDQDMHIPHNHVHIKQIKTKTNKADEIEKVQEF